MAASPVDAKHYTNCVHQKLPVIPYQRKNLVPVSVQRNSLSKKVDLLEEIPRGWPTRNNGEYSRRRYASVRYLNNIKSLKDKIKAPYTCNQHQCKMIKERQDEHNQEHHSNDKAQEFSAPELLSESSSTSRYHEMSVSSTESCSMPYFVVKSKESQSVQTEINPIYKPNLQDYSHGPITSREILDNCKTINNNVMNNDIELKSTATREVLKPKHNFYKEYVRNETVKWMKKLPMNAETDAIKKILIDNLINTLVEEICKRSEFINDENYEKILIIEIDKCLNEMPMWLPGDKREQGPFKDKLSNDLLNNIKNLNNRLFREDKPNSSKYRSAQSIDLSDKTKDGSKYLADIDIHIIENEIREWLSNIKMEKDESGNNVSADEISHLLLNKLEYLLKAPKVAAQYKFTLKGEILEVLKKLPICVKRPATKMVQLYKLAEELANRLLGIQARHARLKSNKIQNVMFQRNVDEIMNIDTPMNFKNNVFTVIGECLDCSGINYNKELLKEISDIVLNSLVTPNNNILQSHVNDITKIMQNYCNISPNEAVDTAKSIVIQVRNIVRDRCPSNFIGKGIAEPRLSGIMSVYTSEERNTTLKYPITSTPKKVTIPKLDIPRQNPEEIHLTTYLADAIQEWMGTLPISLNTSEEIVFREAIINELAGEIVETLRNMQLMPSTYDRDAVAMAISNWLVKFRIFDKNERHINEIQNLYERIFVRINTVPILTRPQHGSRQAVGQLLYREQESQIEYVPKGIDILEDEISIWMNQQPEEMYVNNDRNIRGRMVHELAEKVQQHLVQKNPEREIQNEVKQWLNTVISPDAKVYIPEMTDELRDRLKILPQDATLHKEHIERMQAVLERQLAKANAAQGSQDESVIEKTMKEFIQKFIEQYYEVEDQFARRALTRVLKNELMKLKPPTRKEVYDNFTKNEPNALFAPEQFVQELEYIKLLSDWLNFIPVDPNYKAFGNKHRVNFIQYVAKYITAIENERSRAPGAMNYDVHLANIIMSYLTTLPIPNEQKVNMARMIDQLLSKLSTYRDTIRQKARRAPIINDLGEFIDEYVRKYGVDICDNEIKLEIWTDRLMNEIQKIVYETSNPADLTQTQVYNRLANVSMPLDETVQSFVLEMNYITEIIEWMKNLPLSPITSKEDQDNRVTMVSDLAEKLFERKIRKVTGVDDTHADPDAIQYIANWISQLPLEPQHEIVLPVLIKQLLNRVDRADESKSTWDITTSDVTRVSGKSYQGVARPEPKPKVAVLKTKEYKNRPEALIVDTVEKFCNALPIRGDNQEAIKSIKNEIMKKVLQKTGELNVDPVVFNDASLYRDVFIDEVNDIIEQAPINQDAAKNIEKLKEELIETIIDANEAIKEKSAGDEYKQNLENVINTSVPNPVSKEVMPEAGFELYKNRLVNMFILENFDHSNEDLKLKYERQIKSEIDRYFECARNRSAIPLTKDQIYNQLYSGLFKVPIPNEISVVNEVEIVKTRCEIDTWFEKLPLREAYNLNEELEWDQILATLAKRIHEIEKNEQNAHDKIHKEIKNWLPRLPILPAREDKFDEYASMLQNALRTTAESRKCVTSKAPKGGKAKGKKTKEQIKQGTGSVAAPKLSTKKIVPTPKIPCCQTTNEPQGNPADLILEAVSEWCLQLPLLGNTVAELEQYKDLKEEIFTKIIIKLTELNADPQVFANDFMYNELLDEELDNVLNMMPTSYDVQQNREARKMQLKQQITSLKGLIKKDIDRQYYKDTLRNTVMSVLGPPANMTSDKVEMFNNLVEEIVEDFVQLHYNKNDEEGRQYYKSKIQEIVMDKFYEIRDQAGTEPPVNPLVKINQLLCELVKVPIPDNAILKDEVEEIRMREQVGQFFEQLPYTNKDEKTANDKDQVKLSLAKQLANVEKNGHNCSSENKMRTEIAKHLKKLNVEVLPQVIDKFVQQLKNNEAERKAPPPEDELIPEIRDMFEAVQVRPFVELPQANISGTVVNGNMFTGSAFTPVGHAPARLAIPGTGTHPLAASGEPIGPTPGARVTFTPQPTAQLVHRPAAPGAGVRTPELSDEEDDRCKCSGRMMRIGGRRPTCILRRNSDGRDYCVPMPRPLRRMPFPGFLYF